MSSPGKPQKDIKDLDCDELVKWLKDNNINPVACEEFKS